MPALSSLPSPPVGPSPTRYITDVILYHQFPALPACAISVLVSNPKMDMEFVLVTGATGFIGAHIVDALLARGIRVRGATRSLAKGEAMMAARPQHAHNLEFVQIEDFENPGGLVEAVKDVDGVIHTASVGGPADIFYSFIWLTRAAIYLRHNRQ